VTQEQQPSSRYRLPRTVVPVRYELTLEPDLDTRAFVGSEDVTVEVLEPASEIVLNAVALEISDGWIAQDGDQRVEVTGVELDEETERAHLRLADAVSPGKWTLHLGFRGVLDEQLRGFYPSTYADDAGTTHTIATTQFESTDARRAFPCWDEPEMKAVFGVTLVVGDGLLAISNAPEVERRPLSDGRMAVRFADTMKMSSYLVAFVVGRLDVTEAVDVDGVPLRIVFQPGKRHLADFALEIGAFSLRFFTEYYGIPYPDAKLDMVALPDFAQGAMENVGCITYRETLLLADTEKATTAELMGIADTVAHEIAHMWFGDLVTMRWWNGIWLNEAFATFMEMMCVNAYRPDWERWTLFARMRSAAFEVDALEHTRPIEYPVDSPDDAAGMFDTLTYVKGASVLRMMEQYLGAERFRDGIRYYLKRHAYANTETHDLWDAIEEATGEPVRRIMDGWILKGGYPIVSVEAAEEEAHLTQGRFRLSGGDDGSRWDVPLLVRHDRETEPFLIEAERRSFALRDPAAPVVVNAGGHAFVRVRYDEELLGRISASLGELSPVERYQLADDTWAAVLSGAVDPVAFCTFAEAFTEETDLSVWQSLLTGLAWFERFVEGEPRERFAAFVRGIARPALDRTGWEASDGEPDLTKMLRGTLVASLGVTGADPEVQAFAREVEAEFRAGDTVDPALAAASVQVVAASGGTEDYDRFVQRWKSASTPQEQLRYLYSLGEFRDPALVDRTVALARSSEVRSQNLPSVWVRSVANREYGERAWDALKEHWSELERRIAPTTLVYCVDGIRFLTTPELVADAQAFFDAHPIAPSRLMLLQLLERQRVNASLRARAAEGLAARFS
jgi:puromycin-sensitive aminopeptidase